MDALPPVSVVNERQGEAPAGGKLVKRGDGILADARFYIAYEPAAAQYVYDLYNALLALSQNTGGYLDSLSQYGIKSLSYGGYWQTNRAAQWRMATPDDAGIVFYLTDHPEDFNGPGFIYGADWCAFHGQDGAQPYAVVSSVPAAGCKPDGWTDLDSITSTAAHELTEALTDTPPGSGWTDSSGEESDDFSPCVWDGVKVNATDGRVYTVQTHWRNDTNGCWIPQTPKSNQFTEAAIICPHCNAALVVSLETRTA